MLEPRVVVRSDASQAPPRGIDAAPATARGMSAGGGRFGGRTEDAAFSARLGEFRHLQ
ncbi:conserved hypothetical protein, partial [Ricinus communis]